jgi:hypothetical protein
MSIEDTATYDNRERILWLKKLNFSGEILKLQTTKLK